MTHRGGARLKGVTGILPAALLAYVLVLSALFGGVSAGMAAGATSDHALVICAPSGQPGPDEPSNTHEHDCPCGLLCQTGSTSLAVTTAFAALPALAPITTFKPTSPRVALRKTDRGLTAEARAPPSHPA